EAAGRKRARRKRARGERAGEFGGEREGEREGERAGQRAGGAKVNHPPPDLSRQPLWQHAARAWDRFWFSPADPTVLAVIRICCGLITLYTALAYFWSLSQLIGPHAWVDAQGRLDELKNRPMAATKLNWDELAAHRPPTTQKERRYRDDYLKRWGQLPPGEYPLTDDQEGALNHYRA